MLNIAIHYLDSYNQINTVSNIFILFYEVDSKTGLCNPISEVYIINELNSIEILNTINWNDKAFDNNNNKQIMLIIKCIN
jgi:hypothetical protein